jgi:predicted anti-sigma-YlaC factor YlaD
MHSFAEATLAGLPVTDAMLLVKQHLERCKDCREEFEALLVMLQQSADLT